MSRRNKIVLEPDPRGKRIEGFVATGETFYPGMCVQMDPTVTLKGGRHTCKIFNRDADGNNPAGPHIIVVENYLLGKTISDSYAAGERFFGYVPLPGDELNLLLLNIGGTTDDHTAGEILIVDDGTGKFIATTGGSEVLDREPAMLLETVTDPTVDTLAWCVWAG